MSSVDNRIISLRFDNVQFEQGARTSMATLAKLKDSMNLNTVSTGATKALSGVSSTLARFGIKNPFSSASQGLADVQQAADSFSTGTMQGQVTGLNKTFFTLSAVATATIFKITQGFLGLGKEMAQSLLGLNAMKDGFADYELKIGATQTIMAGTGEDIGTVTAELKKLDIYADKTIYSLSDMTSNIGKFTNAGVKLPLAVKSLQGVAQVAALSGANSNEAARAMYNLGQAIGQGKVRLMDWKSVELANMGTKEFKEQLIDSAVAMGALKKAADGTTTTAKGTEVTFKNFGTTLSEDWLSAKVLTTTLARYSDETTEIGKKATKAAQEVKTFSMMMETLKAAAGTGWTDTYEIFIGNLPEATELFTNVTNSISGVLSKSADARNKLLGDWKKFGGRTNLIMALKNVFASFGKVFQVLGTAYRTIFPRTSVKDLLEITNKFLQFSKTLNMSFETTKNLSKTLKGVFAVFHIVWTLVKGLIGVFFGLFGTLRQSSGSFLAFTAKIGDMLVALDQAITTGDGLKEFFADLTGVLSIPIRLFAALAGFIADIFKGFDQKNADAVSNGFESMSEKLSPIQALSERISTAFSGLNDVLGKIGKKIGEVLYNIGASFGDAFSGGNFQNVLDTINTVLFGGFLAILRKFTKNGLSFEGNFSIFGGLQDVFGGLTGYLKAMQQEVKANMILKIAIAIGILAVSVAILAAIDSEKLTKAMVAISGMFIQLSLAAKFIEGIGGGVFSGVKVGLIAAGLILLAGAILILSLAVKIMSTMSWDELARGLAGVTALLIVLSAASVPLSKNAAGMIRAGVGITAMSVGILILAAAVKIFATISWEEMGRGLTAMAGALSLVVIAANLIPSNIALVGPGLVAFATAVAILGGALMVFGGMNWKTIWRGLGAMAGALALVTAAVNLMPASVILIGPGLVAVAGAIVIMAGALKLMGMMSGDEIAKGLGTLAGALTILSVALNLMTGTLTGAAALVIAAGALAILTPILVTLGSLSLETIGKGLLALAGIFTVLALGGLMLGPVVPVLIGLGAAITLLGAGLMLAGAGFLMFATGYAMIVALGSVGTAILLGAIGGLIDMIPEAAVSLGNGLVQMVLVLAKNAPVLSRAFTVILNSFLDAIIRAVPKIGQLFTVLINTGLTVLRNTVPRMVATGIFILMSFLRGIRKNISDIVDVVSDIIVRFLDALNRNLPKIIDAGVRLIISFVNGLSTAINNHVGELRSAGLRLAYAIINGMTGGLLDWGVTHLRSAIDTLVSHIPSGIKKLLHIESPSKVTHELGRWTALGLANGISDNARHVAASAEEVGNTALKTLQATMSNISDSVTGLIDLNPSVTPVLDLTQLTKDASRMSSILATSPLDASVSYNNAAKISADTQAAQIASLEQSTTPVVQEIKLEQNNYSPKAIDPVTTYRNTKSLLSLTKEALATT